MRCCLCVLLCILGLGVLLRGWALPVAAQGQNQPTIQIRSPTVAGSYVATGPTLQLAGTASARQGLERVTYSTSGGQSGTALGTTSWAFALTLPAGQTTVTVRAVDTRGRAATDTLVVTLLTPPAPVSHLLAWDYAAEAAQFGVEQCEKLPTSCAMVQVATVPGDVRTIELDGLDSAITYCWQIVITATGQRSNTVCTAAAENTPIPPGPVPLVACLLA
jgi:Bacterial Ig domain